MSTINSIGSFIRRLHTATQQDPVRDWLVMISGAVVLLVGIIAWNAWAFSTTEEGVPNLSPVATTSDTFSRASLDTITTIFGLRATEAQKYSVGTYHYSDPSL